VNRFFFMVLFVLMIVSPASARAGQNCIDCHDDHKFRVLFAGSVHGSNGCVSCHAGIKDNARHAQGTDKTTLLSCGSCHRDIAQKYRRNFHYLQEDFRCYDCHQEIHGIKKRGKNIKLAEMEGCTRCHSNEDYVASGHGEAILRGNQDAAACSDCHGLHDTRVFHTSLESYPAEAREFYTEKCKFCHADAQMMKRSGLSAKIVGYYEQTYHGKVQDIGYPTRVAGCADCHTYHNVLPKEDPRSSIHPSNLEVNCGRCHKGFHPRFVDYKAHPDYLDRKRYPPLFWTFVAMTGLLVFTFGFFWVHTGLWWRKTYWEKHRMEKLGLERVHLLAHEEEIQQIQRFSVRERVLHVLLIVSFFVLVMTGFPIKYHDAAWSRVLIKLWGGAHMAGLYHRAAALLLIAIVAYVGWMSIRYLFPRGQGVKGLKERLLGPDSLVPNWKDWEDLKGMFRWFFDRGEMPKFDRWTYWEKFDFWAVFWGMFAIGGSGFLLWKPEWSSYIVPGWIMNVAALVHSEEALLAALFIFTVHFFNTHFIPTKFPMDRLIFTGRVTLEELREQRPLEYERLVAENRLESLKREYPGIPLKLLSGAFGLASLLLGFLLTLFILWTMLFH
jgi:cytochrome b subunit of formate dehydrogenase